MLWRSSNCVTQNIRLPFAIDQAKTLEELTLAAESGQEPEELLALDLDHAMTTCFPTREITAKDGENLALGKWLEPVGNKDIRAAVTPDGRAIALIRKRASAPPVFSWRPHGMN